MGDVTYSVLMDLAYVFFRSARRVVQHMDRVELELVTLNRQIAELTDRAPG